RVWGEGEVYRKEESSIAGLEAAYLSGQTTAPAVTQAYLDRIEAYDKRGPLINSLITINPHALEEADRLDALLKTTGKLVGPLHGIPVIVKDNIDVAGLPMTSGFQGWKNYVPPSDATIVKKIREAGGIILAKTSLSEFALAQRVLGQSIDAAKSGEAQVQEGQAAHSAPQGWAGNRGWWLSPPGFTSATRRPRPLWPRCVPAATKERAHRLPCPGKPWLPRRWGVG